MDRTRSDRTKVFFFAVWMILILALAVLVPHWRPSSKFTPDNPAGFFTGLTHGFLWLLNLLIATFSEGDTWRLIYEFDSTPSYPVGFGIGSLLTLLGKLMDFFSWDATPDVARAAESNVSGIESAEEQER